MLNEYLFWEFGCDRHEPVPPISSTSPFSLDEIGVISRVVPAVTVFRFEADRSFFAVAGPRLSYFPVANMSLEDLGDQFAGSEWIGERDPVDSNTSVIGDPRLPPAIERREALQALASDQLGTGAVVREGLFLRKSGDLIALAELGSRSMVVSTVLPNLPVRFPGASATRRLSAAVGRYLRSETPLEPSSSTN